MTRVVSGTVGVSPFPLVRPTLAEATGPGAAELTRQQRSEAGSGRGLQRGTARRPTVVQERAARADAGPDLLTVAFGPEAATTESAAAHLVELSVAGATARGLAVALEITDPPMASGLLPHEHTDSRAVERRVGALLRARVDRDPLLLTHRAGGRLVSLAAADTAPLFEAIGGQTRVVVSRIGAATTEVLAGLSDRLLLVADGHHRLAASAALAREGHRVTATALVVDADETPLTLTATHRVVVARSGREDVSRTAAEAVHDALVRTGALEVTPGEANQLSAQGLVPGVAGTSHASAVLPAGTVTVQHGDRSWHLGWPGAGALAAITRTAETVASLPGLTVRLEGSEAAARSAAARGSVALLVPPPDLDDLFALARLGQLLPYKTTSFAPKLPPGLIVRRRSPLDDPS